MDEDRTANDHDLLIRLHEQLKNLSSEVKAIAGSIVEKVKADLALAMDVLNEAKEEAKRVAGEAQLEARRVADEAAKDHEDHEKRLRFLERALAWATGALALSQVAMAYLLK